ncbi:MAG: DNA/RNA non-specific endonuclease [Eubacterium sp.]
MIGNFRENTPPTDVNSGEIRTPVETPTLSGAPSLSDLKDRLQDIFPQKPSDILEHPEMPQDKTVDLPNNDSTITLDDGTKVEIPSGTLDLVYSSETSEVAPSVENNEAGNADIATPNAENTERTPNIVYEVDGVTYKIDDNGNAYMVDGKLEPNSTYELNGSVYTTDDKGRIISCEAKPQRSPENFRDNDAQREAGGEDRKEKDQGGHIVGRDLNGDGGGGNVVAMDSKINQSDYKRMENDVKTALDEGKDVTTKTDITYEGDSDRPDKITVTVSADGKDTVYKFDNNLDDLLVDEVPENEKEAVQLELDDTGGTISSIKEEYDENGNLVKTTVNVTYADEDGSTRRTKVVIENAGGEN